ncbi:MAG: FAD-binding protein [Candidatus Lokiarchaeota archaeon]|nr:FAD-binding protein [Candidatus Lokiarchaeota archaeon]
MIPKTIEIVDELEKIVGSNRITNKKVDLYQYSFDCTENEQHMPDCVIMPETVEELQEIVKVASSYKTPLIPYITGSNVGGLTIPLKGGIIVDQKLMNRIIEINEFAMYALIEPGVTFGQLKNELEKYPDLKYSYSFAPPNVSVMANALLAGYTNLGTAQGTTGEGINGMEVILYDGTLAKIGSCFLNSDLRSNYHSRFPIPDMTSLFICWQGMSGFVTKLAVELHPKSAIDDKLWVVVCFDAKSTTEVMYQLGRLELIDDISTVSVETAHLWYEMPKPIRLVPGEPKFVILLTISAHNRKHYDIKMEIIHEKLKEIEKELESRIILVAFNTFIHLVGDDPKSASELPAIIEPLVSKSGISWVGTICSPEVMTELIIESKKILSKYEKPEMVPMFEMKSMKASHYQVFRVFTPFDKYSDSEVKYIKDLNQELLDMVLEKGAIPYKAGVNFTPKILNRADEGWKKLFTRIKKVMDPNGIFNPGRWEFDVQKSDEDNVDA